MVVGSEGDGRQVLEFDHVHRHGPVAAQEHQVPLENEKIPIPGFPERTTSDVHRLMKVVVGLARILPRP